jgi:type III secretion protein V
MYKSFAGNIFLAFFVLAIALLLLVPLPTGLLDVLLAFNISFSLLLLLVGLYMPNALALLAFPSILLLSTLFRLGLNVASTRLILSQGDAGSVIQAFGDFLIQGEIVVGIIIFIIITIVNFIVIAKGASRVSEVAARFALDALPGKQMAIDADLRAGVIDAQQAEQKRENLRKESQLYGSMDGAMKFVQGDAIAGFFIIFTNILGGIYLGVSQGLDFSSAIQTYSTLTVGDGLVSQIPALLISICAGIVVTRVSSGENTTLGSDLHAQLLKNPVLLLLTAGVVAVIGFLPGMPIFPFLVTAISLIITAYMIKGNFKGGLIDTKFYKLGSDKKEVLALPSNKPIVDSGILSDDRSKLILYLDESLLSSLYLSNQTYYLECWQSMQNTWFEMHGLRLLDLQIKSSAKLALGEYQFAISGSVIRREHLQTGATFIDIMPSTAEVFGFELIKTDKNPIFDNLGIWTAATNENKKIAEAANLNYYDSIEFIFLEIIAYLQAQPSELLGITDVHSILKQTEKSHPGLLKEAFTGQFMNVARLTEILQQLAKEGMSLRDIRQIIESIASYCSTYRGSMVNNEDFDLSDVVTYIRRQRKRQLQYGMISVDGKLKLAKVSKQFKEYVEASRLDRDTRRLNFSQADLEKIRQSFDDTFEPVMQKGIWPLTLLVSTDIKIKMQVLFEMLDIRMKLLTEDEYDYLKQSEVAISWDNTF